MELLCKKVKTDYGLSWPKGYLGKLLKNPFYHGVMIVKNKAYPHRYTPIISQSVFEQARGHSSKGDKNEENLLYNVQNPFDLIMNTPDNVRWPQRIPLGACKYTVSINLLFFNSTL